MKHRDELKSNIQAIQQRIVETTKNKRAEAFKGVNRLYREFGYAAGMLKGSSAEGRKYK